MKKKNVVPAQKATRTDNDGDAKTPMPMLRSYEVVTLLDEIRGRLEGANQVLHLAIQEANIWELEALVGLVGDLIFNVRAASDLVQDKNIVPTVICGLRYGDKGKNLIAVHLAEPLDDAVALS